jgi:hypothetical protein
MYRNIMYHLSVNKITMKELLCYIGYLPGWITWTIFPRAYKSIFQAKMLKFYDPD